MLSRSRLWHVDGEWEDSCEYIALRDKSQDQEEEGRETVCMGGGYTLIIILHAQTYTIAMKTFVLSRET